VWPWCNLAASQTWPYCTSLRLYIGLVCYVTVAFAMTEWADQLHHDDATSHSTAFLQAFLAKHHITQVWQISYSTDLAPCDFLALFKAEIAIGREEICECDGHTIHKVSQQLFTVIWLVPGESESSWMHSKVSSDWLPSYIEVTRRVLKIFKLDRYSPDRPPM